MQNIHPCAEKKNLMELYKKFVPDLINPMVVSGGDFAVGGDSTVGRGASLTADFDMTNDFMDAGEIWDHIQFQFDNLW